MGRVITLETIGKVVLVRLNRPEALNALNNQIMTEICDALEPLDSNRDIGCFVLTGTEKAFAAGADIKEMASLSYMDSFHDNLFAGWDRFTRLRTPKIAAVNGYALGGGCELAMMCDIIYAGENAKFGQPEIKLGVIPGMGGSQRLTRAIGKAKAMDMILTGRMMGAIEAEQAGLVAQIFSPETLVEETLKQAEIIANFSKASVMMAREAVDRALETGLNEGLLFERRAFHALFSTADQKEGMAAFSEKRPPQFTGE